MNKVDEERCEELEIAMRMREIQGEKECVR